MYIRMCTYGFMKLCTSTYELRYSYLLIPWSRVLIEKLTVSQLVKKFPAFYGTRRFITHSQVSAICPSSEPALSSPYPSHPNFLKIHLHMILPSTPGSAKWYLGIDTKINIRMDLIEIRWGSLDGFMRLRTGPSGGFLRKR